MWNVLHTSFISNVWLTSKEPSNGQLLPFLAAKWIVTFFRVAIEASFWMKFVTRNLLVNWKTWKIVDGISFEFKSKLNEICYFFLHWKLLKWIGSSFSNIFSFNLSHKVWVPFGFNAILFSIMTESSMN